MGYVFHLEDSLHCDDWFRTEAGRRAFELEKELLLKVWDPSSSQRVLEVGCGTGRFLEWFADQGHLVTGIEPSESVLSLARRRLPRSVRLDRGSAEQLPYDDNEFDTVALITTLEFVDDPCKALSEAFRVARSRVLIGALNSLSITGAQRHLERLIWWKETLYRHARFFSVFELKKMSMNLLAGSVPVKWRTCFSFPFPLLNYLHFLERSELFHLHPFGHFIAMRINVKYRFRTVQTPVFSKVSENMGQGSVRSLCWREASAEDESNLLPLP